MRSPLAQRGFRQLISIGGDGVKCLKTAAGAKVSGLLQINPMFDLPSDLISDSREKALLEVERNGLPPIKQGDPLTDSGGNKWGVWNRDDNPATFTTKFWLVKNVPQLG